MTDVRAQPPPPVRTEFPTAHQVQYRVRMRSLAANQAAAHRDDVGHEPLSRRRCRAPGVLAHLGGRLAAEAVDADGQAHDPVVGAGRLSPAEAERCRLRPLERARGSIVKWR